MGIHICVKLKWAALLNFTVHPYTVISPHNHFCGLHTPAHIQAVSITMHLDETTTEHCLTSSKMQSYVL